jgi:hypothetical protein
MSKILKKFCGIFGYKLLPKYYVKNKNYLSNLSCLNLKKIILNLVEKKIINSLIQIGANDGVTHDHLHDVIKKFRLQSLLLEPIKEHFLNLTNNYSNFENVRLENSALSINNEILFYISQMDCFTRVNLIQNDGPIDSVVHLTNQLITKLLKSSWIYIIDIITGFLLNSDLKPIEMILFFAKFLAAT